MASRGRAGNRCRDERHAHEPGPGRVRTQWGTLNASEACMTTIDSRLSADEADCAGHAAYSPHVTAPHRTAPQHLLEARQTCTNAAVTHPEQRGSRFGSRSPIKRAVPPCTPPPPDRPAPDAHTEAARGSHFTRVRAAAPAQRASTAVGRPQQPQQPQQPQPLQRKAILHHGHGCHLETLPRYGITQQSGQLQQQHFSPPMPLATNQPPMTPFPPLAAHQ